MAITGRPGRAVKARRAEVVDGRWLRVVAELPAEADGAPALVLRGGDAELRAPMAPAGDEAEAYVALVDLAAGDERTVWALAVAAGDGPERALELEAGTAPGGAAVVAADGVLFRMRPQGAGEGALTVEATRLPPHAEVRRVHVDNDGVTLVCSAPGAAESGQAELEARRRADGREVRVPARPAADGTVETHLPFAALPSDGGDAEVWDLRLGGARVGAHLDGVPNKRRSVMLPSRRVRRDGVEREVRPYYTAEDNLSIRSRPVGPPARRARQDVSADEDGPRRVARDRLLRPAAVAVHRAGARLAQTLFGRGRRAPAEAEPTPTPALRPS